MRCTFRGRLWRFPCSSCRAGAALKTCLVAWFLRNRACRESCKTFLMISKEVAMSWQAWHLARLRKCRKSFCVTGALFLQGFQFSEHYLHFWWQVQHFVNVNSIYVRVSIRVRGLHLVFFVIDSSCKQIKTQELRPIRKGLGCESDSD